MSGRGKGGKGLGKGGAKRHRKILRDNIQGITKPAIRRLARRGGVKRISGLIYEETRGVLKVFLENVIRDSVTYTEHAKRKTVTALDVVYALKRQGRILYGFAFEYATFYIYFSTPAIHPASRLYPFLHGMPNAKPTLTIDLPNSHNVLQFKPLSYIQSRTIPDYTVQDVCELRGTLELFLPTVRRIKAIRVTLKNVEEVIIRGKSSRRIVLEETVTVNTHEELMERGVHIYEFNLRVDSRTPTYERHPCGGTLQYLEAIVEFNEMFSRSLTHRIPLLFVSHPMGDGVIPLDHTHQDYVDDLGPFEVSFKTQHLTVGGFILVEMYLPSPAPGLEVRAITVSLEQHTSVHDDGKLMETLPVDTHTLLSEQPKKDASCLIKVPENSAAIKSFHYAKLPTDDYCRPSTLDWSLARLRQQHFITFDLLYKKDKLRCATVKIPVILPQCLLSVDSVTLPTYGEAGYPVPTKRLWDQPLPRSYTNCSCGKDSLILKADAEGVHDLKKYKPRDEGIWIANLRVKEESISSRDSHEEVRAAKRVNEYRGIEESG
ncbi:hypothetical protein E3P99_01119 [Wallemia hederae]|uniref:Histone H4 n=1 Tax=Wallemia hederae TaxID=1540922 RepID=A0A4T0FRW3_9BASI|nr:hypothetical protein E3P99_01119 [Wallemia hederae]